MVNIFIKKVILVNKKILNRNGAEGAENRMNELVFSA